MDKLDRSENWADDYHFKAPVCQAQAKIIADRIQEILPAKKHAKKLKQLGSETGPSGKMK